MAGLLSPLTVLAPPSPVFAQAAAEETLPITRRDARMSLRRFGIRAEGEYPPDLDVLLATPLYFAVFDGQPPPEAEPGPTILFYVQEDGHDDLPEELPHPMLSIDGGDFLEPDMVRIVSDEEHHRATMVVFRTLGTDGKPLVTEDTRLLELAFPAPLFGEGELFFMGWELPIPYNGSFSSSDILHGTE